VTEQDLLNGKKHRYTDVSTVESQRNDLTAEEFPEGPYGSSLVTESLGKSKPWRLEQRSPNRFGYENRELHDGLDRDYPGDQGTVIAAPEVMDEP